MENKTQAFTDVCAHLAVLILAYLTPLKPFVIVIAILIVFDYITGVRKAYLSNELKISTGIGTTIDKIIAYGMFILVIFMIEVSLLQVDWGLTKVAVSIAGLREAISIFENLAAITKMSIFTEFSNVLKDKLKLYLQIKSK